MLLGACEPVIRSNIDAARATAAAPVAKPAMYLDDAARANSVEMCAAGAVAPSPDATADYDGETAVAVEELVAAAPLDLSIPDGVERNLPATGRYATPVFPSAAVDVVPGLVYGTAVDHQGVTINLLLDVYLPSNDVVTERPLILFVHGGGFSSGSRTSFATAARDYARRGFVVASIDYRLRPNDTPAEQLVAASQAIDDAMESVRWLKANAVTYGIDTDRIAALGSSAGGAIVIGVGHSVDPTPGGPLSAYAPTVTAIVSTGAHLTPALTLINFEDTDAPSMMFHYEQDTSPGQATWDFAYQTCTAIREGGPPCDFIRQPGSGHTIPMGPVGPWWVPEIGPFVWHHLGLAG